jgi:hypothetical protein
MKEKMMKYSLVWAAAVALFLSVAVSSTRAVAQDASSTPQSTVPGPGQPAANPESRNDTAQAFDHWMRQNPEASEQIRKDPALLNNPEYLSKHPELQEFMNNHPDFKAAAAKNPNKVLHRSERQQHMARERKEARRDAR